ncbi:MAG TPA: STAS domain-containing protein [Solirubrobacteraceae bacterium]|nr:STAS domain-containing protein [Solirubrobacteraceae bacterium]
MTESEHLRVDVQGGDGRVIVRLGGELDLASAPVLERELESAQIDAAPSLVFDLDGLEFLDSTGLQVLLATHRHATEHGQQFAITRGSPQVQRLLDITRVAERLTIVDAPV